MDLKDGFGRSGVYGLLILILGIFGFVYYEMMRYTDPQKPAVIQQKATTTTKASIK